MAKKELKFHVNQLIINSDSVFSCTDFDPIKDEATETHEIKKIKGEGNEILSVKKVLKKIYENRFVALSFDEGAKFPYPPTVVNSNLDEESNPRAPDQIELDQQFFILVDTETKRIWISEYRKKNSICVWLKEKLNSEVEIKSIFKDGEFMEKIKSIKEISFSIVPNLFNAADQDILSHHLLQDIYGFGAQKAKLKMEFNNSEISDIIKRKVNELIGRKNEFLDITVIGRSDGILESTFNLEEITSKVSIEATIKETSKLLDPDEVFKNLINKIKEV